MPGKKKKLIRERMKKTGETHASALRSLREAIRPTLPTGPTSVCFTHEGYALPDDGSRPEWERVFIQDGFDPLDPEKAWVPASAYYDPTMRRDPSWPPDVMRVLSLGEYIRAREKQLGRRLDSMQPGAPVSLDDILGFPASPTDRRGCILHVDLVWAPRMPCGGGP